MSAVDPIKWITLCGSVVIYTAAARTRHTGLQRGDPKNLDRVRGELEQSVTLLLEVHTNNIHIILCIIHLIYRHAHTRTVYGGIHNDCVCVV